MDKKEEIIIETFKLFAGKGYNTSMSDIAKAVNIKVPSIYSHFRNKDEILFTVVSRELEKHFEGLNQKISQVANLDFEDKLKEIFYYMAEYFSGIETIRFWKNIALTNNTEIARQCNRLMVKKQNQFSKTLINIFGEGYKLADKGSDKMEGEAFLYWTMLQGIMDAQLLYYDEGHDFYEFTEKLWKAYLSGIHS